VSRRAALAAPLACALFGCVSVAEFRKLETQVHELRGGEVGAQTRSQLADLVASVDRLSKEVDELRGSMEVAQHRADQAI
jgi:outer membrane murein-binding lipoprotein Lpp